MTQQIAQSLREKLRIFIPVGLLMIGCIIFMGLWFARFASVSNLQTIDKDNNPNHKDDVVAYDVYCSTTQVALKTIYLKDPNGRESGINALKTEKTGDKSRDLWTDAEKAYGFMENIYEDCDEDCMNAGSAWSMVLLMNGLLMIFIFLNLGCVIMGRIKAFWRVLAAYAGFVIFLVNLAILSVTGYLRYRPQGALCSVNADYTHAPNTNHKDVDDSWTYEKDGSMMLGLWLVQAVFM